MKLPTRLAAALLLAFAVPVAAQTGAAPGNLSPTQAANLANAVAAAQAARGAAAGNTVSGPTPTPANALPTPANAASLAAEMVRLASGTNVPPFPNELLADQLTPAQVLNIGNVIKVFQDLRTSGPGGNSPFDATELANVNATIRILQETLARIGSTQPPAPAAPGTFQLPGALAASFADAVYRDRSGPRGVTPPPSRPAVATFESQGLRLGLQSLSENRTSSGTGTTNVSLSLSGEGLPVISFVRQVTITKALDDQEHSVMPPAGRGGVTSGLSVMNAAGRGGLSTNAYLGMAARTATALKLVEGTLELAVPTDANGGIIRIPGIKLHSGRIEQEELTKRGIAVVFATDQESYDEAINLRSSVMRGGGGGSNVVPDGKKTFVIYYHDTGGLAIGAQLQDAQGNALTSRATGSSGGSSGGMRYSLTTLTIDAGLPDDAQLAIFVAAPGVLKNIPFHFENVPLP